METGTLKKTKFLYIFFIIVIVQLIFGCDGNTMDKNAAGDMDAIEVDGTTYIETELQTEMLPGDVKRIKDVLINKVLPIIPEAEKDELNEIIHHLDYIQENSPEYFEDDNNLIEFFKTVMRFNLLSARLNPNNFDLHLIVATKYIEIAASLEGHPRTNEGLRISEEFKKRGVQAAKLLVEKFPENARSYSQYAHSLYIVEGKTKEAAALYKRCLEINEKSENCREGYNILMEKLKSSSQ